MRIKIFLILFLLIGVMIYAEDYSPFEDIEFRISEALNKNGFNYVHVSIGKNNSGIVDFHVFVLKEVNPKEFFTMTGAIALTVGIITRKTNWKSDKVYFYQGFKKDKMLAWIHTRDCRNISKIKSSKEITKAVIEKIHITKVKD